MFAERFAVAVFAVVVGLTGRAYPAEIDLNRPYPAQPIISPDIKAKLSAKKPQEFQWYLEKEVQYYDGSNIVEKMKTAETKKGYYPDFTRFLPILSNPQPATIENADKVVINIKKFLIGNGYNVADEPCGASDKCLTIKVDYADSRLNTTTFFMARVRVYYLGKESLLPRADVITYREDKKPEPEKYIALTAKRALQEMLFAWNEMIGPIPVPAYKKQVSASSAERPAVQ